MEPVLPGNHVLKTRNRYALKRVNLTARDPKITARLAGNEREAMDRLAGGGFIVQLRATFRDADNLYFLMDQSGVDLRRVLVSNKVS